ncbi:MAG: NYN domain-containing protein [Nitrosotalea sp.]
MNSAIFIDAGYLLKVSKQHNRRIDLLKLSNELTAETNRIKTIFYDSLPIQGTPKGDSLYTKRQILHNKLRHLQNFEVKLGKLQKIDSEFFQKGVDMRLGIDLVQMSMTKQIDKAILLTADSDFEYAIQKAQESGAIVFLAYFPSSPINSTFLKSVNGRILLTNDVLDRCKL